MSQLAIHSTKSILKQTRKTEFLKFSIHLRDNTVTFEKGKTSYIVMMIIKFLNNPSANKRQLVSIMVAIILTFPAAS